MYKCNSGGYIRMHLVNQRQGVAWEGPTGLVWKKEKKVEEEREDRDPYLYVAYHHQGFLIVFHE